MIALSLTAILLTFLFSFFVESAKIETKLEAARHEIISRQHLQMRLQSVFMGLSSLYTKVFPDEKQISLVATFDQGIDPDPAFSGPILGRIYLDEEKNLTFATWPLDKEKNLPWRKEILLSDVSDFEFEFIARKKEKELKEKSRPINASLEWLFHWPKSRPEIPSIIRLIVRKEKQPPLQFAFILPSSEPLVTYQEGGFKS